MSEYRLLKILITRLEEGLKYRDQEVDDRFEEVSKEIQALYELVEMQSYVQMKLAQSINPEDKEDVLISMQEQYWACVSLENFLRNSYYTWNND